MEVAAAAAARRGRPAWIGSGRGLGAGRPEGRGQVRRGGVACEVEDRARKLEVVSEGRWPGRGAGSERAALLPTCAVPGTAQVEVTHLGSSPRMQGDLGRVTATLWASVSPSEWWCGGRAGELEALQQLSSGRTPRRREASPRGCVGAPALEPRPASRPGAPAALGSRVGSGRKSAPPRLPWERSGLLHLGKRRVGLCLGLTTWAPVGQQNGVYWARAPPSRGRGDWRRVRLCRRGTQDANRTVRPQGPQAKPRLGKSRPFLSTQGRGRTVLRALHKNLTTAILFPHLPGDHGGPRRGRSGGWDSFLTASLWAQEAPSRALISPL